MEATNRKVKHPSAQPWTSQVTGSEQEDTTEYRFECHVCGLTETTEGKIEAHMTIHDKEEENENQTCKKCPYKTTNRDQVIEHIELTHIQDADLSCKIFKLKFRTNNQLNAHMRNKHKKSHKPSRYFPTQNCEYVDEFHFTLVILKQNEKICYKCGDILSNKTLLLKHIVSVHGEEPCKKFRVNKCTFGTKCFFKHFIEPGQCSE